MFRRILKRIRGLGLPRPSERTDNITLLEIQRVLLKYGIGTHREGGALIWNLRREFGKQELVIEIHEPHETLTNTRDLWVYAPKLVRAFSPVAASLSAHLDSIQAITGYPAKRLLDGLNIGAAWSIPLDVLVSEERLAELVKCLGNQVFELSGQLDRASENAVDREQISPHDFDAVLGYPEEGPAERPPPQSDILDRLSEAQSAWSQGNSAKAIDIYEGLLSLAEGSTPMRLAFQSKILSEMAQIIHRIGPPEKGMEYASRALEIDRQLYGENHNDVAADLLDLAQFCASAHRPKDALEFLKASENVDASLPAEGTHVPPRAYRRISGASVLQNTGFAEQAAHRCIDAVSDLDAHLADYPQQLGDALTIAADCLQDLGEHNTAESWLRKAIDLERRAEEPSPLTLGIRLSNLAQLLHDTGRFDEAVSIMREAQRFPSPKWEMQDGEHRTFEEEVRAHKLWMAERKGKYDFFLSYNSRDEELVKKLHDALESYGLNVFTFREDPKSKRQMLISEILLMLTPHLSESQNLLVVASPTSITSVIVHVEVRDALERNVPVFAWYPLGTRFKPEVASIFSDDTPGASLRFAAALFDYRVRSYYGFGVKGGSIEDLARAILFRHLLLSPTHPLREKQDISELCRSVRHATRLHPYLIDEDGQPLERELYKDTSRNFP